MVIDENRDSARTNYHGLNKNEKITESDHNKMDQVLKLEAPIGKPIREELLNFKDNFRQMKFQNITNNSEQLRNSFKSAATFQNTLQGVFQQYFNKTRLFVGQPWLNRVRQFQNITNNSEQLRNSFKSAATFQNTLQGVFQQYFNKTRLFVGQPWLHRVRQLEEQKENCS